VIYSRYELANILKGRIQRARDITAEADTVQIPINILGEVIALMEADCEDCVFLREHAQMLQFNIDMREI